MADAADRIQEFESVLPCLWAALMVPLYISTNLRLLLAQTLETEARIHTQKQDALLHGFLETSEQSKLNGVAYGVGI